MDEVIKVSKSVLSDPHAAGKEAAQKALDQLNQRSPSFALVFASAGYFQKELLQGITEILPEVPMVGCTGEGVICTGDSDEGSAIVSIMLFSGEGLSFFPFIAKGLKKDSYRCGQQIAEAVNQVNSGSNNTLLLFPDSMTANITEILGALEEKLELPTMILGGTSGDMMKFKQTFQYFNGVVYEDVLVAVYMTGNYDIDYLVSHGCEEIGLEQTVTKSDANKIVKIDDLPAWEAFRDYLPGDPDEFKAEDAFHLCLGELHHLDEPCGEQLIIRMPVGLEKKTGAVKFSVEIPEGCVIRFTRRDPQVIAEKVIHSFKELLARNKGRKPLAVLQFDCAGRGRVLYGSCFNQDVITPLQSMVDANVPWIGFHTYGEIAPLCGKTFFHNFTAVIGVIFDK